MPAGAAVRGARQAAHGGAVPPPRASSGSDRLGQLGAPSDRARVAEPREDVVEDHGAGHRRVAKGGMTGAIERALPRGRPSSAAREATDAARRVSGAARCIEGRAALVSASSRWGPPRTPRRKSRGTARFRPACRRAERPDRCRRCPKSGGVQTRRGRSALRRLLDDPGRAPIETSSSPSSPATTSARSTPRAPVGPRSARAARG